MSENNEVDMNQVCTCPRCKIFMRYVGVRHHMVSICVEKFDGEESYTVDEKVNAPYATWKCEKCGRIETDGY